MNTTMQDCLKKKYVPTAFILVLMVILCAGCGQKDRKAKEDVPPSGIDLHDTDFSDPQVIQHFLYMAYQGSTAVVKAYLNNGMDINQVNENGQDVLMMAAYTGNTQLVAFLIEKGANPESKDAVGRTPLMYAASGPFAGTVKFLLEQGVDPNIVDEDEHWTALMFAASEGHMDVVKLLVRKGANVNLTDVDGDTAASFARKNEHIKIADWLEKRMD